MESLSCSVIMTTKVTPVWTDSIQRLEYLGQELRKMLANSIQEMIKISGPTSGAPITTKARSFSQYLYTTNTTELPSTRQLPNNKESTITAVVILIFIPSVIICICIYMCVKRKSHPQGDRNLQLSMNCPINCHKPQRKERPMESNREFPNQATKMLSKEEEPKT